MKGKGIIPLVLGLAVGLVAVKFGIDAIRRAQASGEKTEKIKAVRARVDIAAFEEITPDMVELIETADSLFAPLNDRVGSIEELKARVTSKAIPARSPVLLSMLAPAGTRAGMVGQIPPGFRAVSVKIDEVTGVAYQLQPDDWVDVIVVMDVKSGHGTTDTIAEVILQHVKVVAIGRSPQSDAASGPSKTRPAKSATLLISEEDVPKLHLAGTRGKLTLAMRGADTHTSAIGHTALGSELFDNLLPKPTPTTENSIAAPRPVRIERPVPYEVAVYRGTNKAEMAVERITFESVSSNRIVDVSQGPPGGSGSTLRSGSARGSGGGGSN
jgi:pilus assembly protein CpaB